MKKLSLLLIGFLFILTSCDGGSSDDNPPVNDPAFVTMKNYMVDNGYDIPKILKNDDGAKFVAGAPAAADLDAFLNKYYIIDIRSKDAYDAGHIQGAKNVAFSNILTEAEAAGDKPVLVVCYSGQTACYATALMRLYGYKDTQALKWGMSGWSEETDTSWDNMIGKEPANGHANWSYGAAPANNVYSFPEFNSIKTDGNDILKSRVEQAVAAGFSAATVAGTDVLDNPANYFINNYFNPTDYSSFGHIEGAYRINPLTLEGGEYLNLDPDATVVTYCYTGQTSAVMTACLRVLGYDAKTLTFGMNGLYNTHNHWTQVPNQWGGDSESKDLPLVK